VCVLSDGADDQHGSWATLGRYDIERKYSDTPRLAHIYIYIYKVYIDTSPFLGMSRLASRQEVVVWGDEGLACSGPP
jgi:hypothetical protein